MHYNWRKLCCTGSYVDNCKRLISATYSRPFCYKDLAAYFEILNDEGKQQLLGHFETPELAAHIDEVSSG